MNETWVDIIGFTGYQISTFSRIRSFKKGKLTILKPLISKGGRQTWYLDVRLYFKSGWKQKRIHVLVAKAFIPNPDNKPLVNHINGIKTDNRVDNLEWVTARENTAHYLKSKSDKPIGITFCKATEKWRAKIYVNGKVNDLGRFKTPQLAKEAYDSALNSIRA